MKNTGRMIIRNGLSVLLVVLGTGLAGAAEPTPGLSKSEVKELIGKASTPEDHSRLAAYFTQKADSLDAEAVEHEELGKEYARNPGIHAMKHPLSGTTEAHCRYFAQAARKAAAEDRALASAHESMAGLPSK